MKKTAAVVWATHWMDSKSSDFEFEFLNLLTKW